MESLDMAIKRIRAKSKTKRGLSYKYYKQYIASKYRKDKKQAKYKLKPFCEVGGVPAECVHHETYHRLGKERMGDLRALCKNCHYKIHFIHNQGKNSKKTLLRAFNELRNEVGVFPYKDNWLEKAIQNKT